MWLQIDLKHIGRILFLRRLHGDLFYISFMFIFFVFCNFLILLKQTFLKILTLSMLNMLIESST